MFIISSFPGGRHFAATSNSEDPAVRDFGEPALEIPDANVETVPNERLYDVAARRLGRTGAS
jgi:hypothetical protein